MILDDLNNEELNCFDFKKFYEDMYNYCIDIGILDPSISFNDFIFYVYTNGYSSNHKLQIRNTFLKEYGYELPNDYIMLIEYPNYPNTNGKLLMICKNRILEFHMPKTKFGELSKYISYDSIAFQDIGFSFDVDPTNLNATLPILTVDGKKYTMMGLPTCQALFIKRCIKLIQNGIYDISYEKGSESKIYDYTIAKNGGCYVATAVYGSYNCPQVWILRKYRDFYLAKKKYGLFFIKFYYLVSPKLVKLFGKRL